MKNPQSRSYTAVMAVVASALALALATSCSARKSPEAEAPADKAPEQRVSVAVTEPKGKTVEGLLSLNGTIHSENVLTVVSETQGKVVRVYAQTGARVSKGDVLVQIDDELKQAAYATAQASFDKSKADWIRAQELYTQKVIADADLAAAKLAYASAESQLKVCRRDLENAKVRTALSGVVSARFVNEGTVLGSGKEVAEIVDTQNFKLVVNIGERDVMKVRNGMQVKIETDTYPDAVIAGTVSAISPKGDTALSFPVEIKIKADPKRPLFDGMSASVGINLGKRNILALPRASLVSSYQNPQVFVVRDGAAYLVNVTVGGEYGTDFELISGLKPGDQVVVSGQNNLNDGQLVEIVGENK